MNIKQMNRMKAQIQAKLDAAVDGIFQSVFDNEKLASAEAGKEIVMKPVFFSYRLELTMPEELQPDGKPVRIGIQSGLDLETLIDES